MSEFLIGWIGGTITSVIIRALLEVYCNVSKEEINNG